ncbi:MAG: type I-F CRISPR-associated endoribonuclease Cas6/Csy4 [Magnetococcales bacterium]|nr:type I-F CRISPR-associated endoribonuclease Cas6/Csy4 [Magnetococcales bacterium]
MALERYVRGFALPGSGLDEAFIFTQALQMLRDARIGHFALAFPECREGFDKGDRTGRVAPTLGREIQLFGPAAVIEAAARLLGARYEDYLDLTVVRPVRASPYHVCYQRMREADRTKATIDRELRRTLRRVAEGKREPPSDAELRERRGSRRASDQPFLSVRSHTTGRTFNLAFCRIECDQPTVGPFDPFGFAKNGATVPLVR